MSMKKISKGFVVFSLSLLMISGPRLGYSQAKEENGVTEVKFLEAISTTDELLEAVESLSENLDLVKEEKEREEQERLEREERERQEREDEARARARQVSRSNSAPAPQLETFTIENPSLAGAVEYAKSKVNPRGYVYGANGPVYFDCSGLAKAALLHGAGIDTGSARSANSLYHHVKARGQVIYSPRGYDNLEPGDLLFYGYGHVYHVALYEGNGRVVHATTPARGIVSEEWNSYHTNNVSAVVRLAESE